MATFEQEQKAKEALNLTLTELAKIQPKDLIRADELGKDLSFESGLPVFERTLKLFHDLHESNLDNISYDTLDSLQRQAKDALDRFKKVQSFSPRQQPQNPIGTRDQLINELREQYHSYFSALSPIIAYSVRKGTDFAALEQNARDTVTAIDGARKTFEQKQTLLVSEMESTLQKVRQAAAEVGVAQHATHFKEEAEQHEKLAGSWLTRTVWAATGTIVWGAASFFIHPENETAKIIQFVVAKLIILSALYYTLVWCARNYNAHRHNYVVNKHRQNSLSTFETFVKAAGDDVDTKNAVLLQATQSIFSGQASGYINKETENETPNKFIEIMRSASSSVSKT